MSVKRGLGRGLNALINEEVAAAQQAPRSEPLAPSIPGSMNVPIGQIHQNPLQPRRHIATPALEEMIQSIRAHGVLEPLLLRRVGAQFEIIAGERRWRAAQQAGLSELPAVIKDGINDQQALELALIENLQREDLNPIEEAAGYQQLLEKFALNQEDIAKRVGKARTTVTNALRLLALPDDVKQMVAEGKLSSGHARALLGIPLDKEKSIMARRALLEGWSVRLLEKAVARLSRAPRKPRAVRTDIPDSHIQFISDKLRRHFGTDARVFPPKTQLNGKKIKGIIELDFYSNEDLTRILEVLGLSDKG